jgi:peptide methionine sulfoxide reductase MsrA|tara:strand:+ start:30 stop:296 length:267 start_codon:yes stop_codon:yes gene_type:complete
MPKYETVVPSDFDADKSFMKAMNMMQKFLQKNETDGKMAMVSLARALGGTLMLTTVKEQRDMALATVITQMCQTFADFLQAEDQHDDV